jgi:hypothetical protein
MSRVRATWGREGGDLVLTWSLGEAPPASTTLGAPTRPSFGGDTSPDRITTVASHDAARIVTRGDAVRNARAAD